MSQDFDKYDIRLDGDEIKRVDSEGFRGNPAAKSDMRRLMVTLVDLSGSMGEVKDPKSNTRPPVKILEDALQSYLEEELAEDADLKMSGELGLAGFFGNQTVEWFRLGEPVADGSHVYWARYLSEYMAKAKAVGSQLALVAQGGTPLGHALNAALDEIEARRIGWAKDNKRPGHRPILLVLTDGHPTDMLIEGDKGIQPHFQHAIDRIHKAEDAQQLVCWVACAGDFANLEVLRPLANKGNLIELGQRDISSFITLMTLSRGEVGGASGTRTAQEIYAELMAKWDSASY